MSQYAIHIIEHVSRVLYQSYEVLHLLDNYMQLPSINHVLQVTWCWRSVQDLVLFIFSPILHDRDSSQATFEFVNEIGECEVVL